MQKQKTKLQVRTVSVTNVKLGIAVLALAAAGALSFAAIPASQLSKSLPPECAQTAFSVSGSCGKNMYRTASVVCGKAIPVQLRSSKSCATQTEWQRLAQSSCAASCPAQQQAVVQQPAPQPQPAPVPVAGEARVELSACGTPAGGWVNGTDYVLSQDIRVNLRENEVCFQPTGTDIVMNGNGHRLMGGTSGIGIRIDGGQTILITNFDTIAEFDTAISIRNGIDIGISGTSAGQTRLSNNDTAISVENGVRVRVEQQRVSFVGAEPDRVGITLTGGRDNVIRNNLFTGLRTPLAAQQETSLDVLNNELTNSILGIRIDGGSTHTVAENNIHDTYRWGLWFVNVTGSQISSNSLTSITAHPVYDRHAAIFENISENQILNNTFRNNTGESAIYLNNSSRNIIRDNTIRDNANGVAIRISASPANIYERNSMERNAGGIFGTVLSPSAGGRFSGNYACGNAISDMNCSGLTLLELGGTGNIFGRLDGCPVQGNNFQGQWPLEGVDYRACVN